jgi:hypothetical protein
MLRTLLLLCAVFLAVALIPGPSPTRAATFTVTSTADSGANTLRQAITTAASGDTINITATGTITPLTELPAIDKVLIITGPGAGSLTISGASCTSCSGLLVVPGGSLTLSRVTIRGFTISGIHSSGNLVSVSNSVITQNAAGTRPSLGAPNAGGGIYATTGSLLVQDSTVSFNTASSWGGGISAQTTVITVTITGSTLNGNQAGGHGGGLYTRAPTTMINSTVSGNNSSAPSGSGGIYNSALFDVLNSTIGDNLGGQWGAGTAATNTITARNTIIARGGGGTGANCTATIFNSLGNNISSDATCALTGPNDRNNTNPLLIALTNNGGPTQTHLVATGSPAIDGGSNTGCPATDQRGLPRPSDGDNNGTSICDVGAVEIQGTTPTQPPSTLPAAATATPTTVPPTVTPVIVVPIVIPQQVQNPAAVMIVQGGIGNGTRNNTPVPSRPAAVAPSTGDPSAVPPIRPPSTGDAGLITVDE